MRISVDEGDKAYDEKWHFADVDIFVDGVHVKYAVTADTTEGYVKCYDLRPSKGGQCIEMHGKVEIKGTL